jgi:Flp pilus assembly protein CpaB
VAFAVVASTAVSRLERLDAARRAWGERRTVWRAAVTVEPGGAIVAAPVEVPLAVVPADALDRSPAGRTAAQHVGAGEIVTTGDLVGAGVRGLAAALRPGQRAVVVTTPGAPALQAGDHVSVYAAGVAVADDAVVVAVGDASAGAGTNGLSVTVAVPSDVAADVARAAHERTAELALRRPDG